MSRPSLYRSYVVAGALALGIVPVIPAFAQENIQQLPDAPNSKFQFEGSINSSAVFVRSGPGDNYYPTQKLDKGAAVTVVGIKFDWLKIVPPDGSFCYIAKGFVERHGDGKAGRVTKADVNVRAGSLVNAMKTTVQSHLNVGDEVQIIEEADEYYKIKPPQDAYLYVNKQFVDPVRSLTAAATPPIVTNNPGAAVSTGATGTQLVITPNDATTVVPGPTTRPQTAMIDPTAVAGATTQPMTVATGATTQPVLTDDEKFAAYEAEFTAMNSKPLQDQPVDELTKKYQSIAKAEGLSDTLKRVVELRVATLNYRIQQQKQEIELQKIVAEAADRRKATEAERTELQEQLKLTEIPIFTAVGTVQASSLQLATGGTLYRLTDPANGRTVIYVHSPDNKMAAMIGKFVGVKGDAGNDPQLPLRVITPTDIEPVDVAKIANNTVAAQMMPPSLIRGSNAGASAE